MDPTQHELLRGLFGADVCLYMQRQARLAAGGASRVCVACFPAGRHCGGSESTLLVRVSAPLDSSSGQLAGRLRKALSQAGVPVQRLSGEQGELLRASTPLGLSEGIA